MKTAEELYEISQRRIPEMVDEIMDGVKEHISKRCEEEAYKGSTYYTCYLKDGNAFVRRKLVERCLDLSDYFEEEKHCKVSIEDSGSDTTCSLVFTVSWNGKPKILGSWGFGGKNAHIYDTDNGYRDAYEEIYED